MKIYELKLENIDSAGVTAISFVEKPAIESNFIYFSKDEEKEKVQFKAIDEDKHLVAGPAMIPDKQIYRIDGEEEYFVYFSETTIRQVSEKFFLDGKINSATFEHEDTLNGVSVVESWIVEDPEKDKSSMYGFSLPVGSWFIVMKVNNPTVWEQIKDQKIKGFSVEGIFANQLIKNSETMDFEKMKNEILDGIKTLFKEEKPGAEDFASVMAVAKADGSEIEIVYAGETLEVGGEITYVVDGEVLPVPTGEYDLPDGFVLIVVEDGKIGEIKEAEAPAAEEEEAEEMDKDKMLTEVIEKVGELLTEALGDFSSQIDTKLAKFKKELNAPGADPETHKPPESEKGQVHLTLNQKIKAKNQKDN